MFIEAAELSQSAPAPFDVCIVGAGAAGLSLVHRLIDSGLRIALVESGGRRGDAQTQVLNAGTSNLDDYPFYGSRTRGFGGTTQLWTGACVRLEPEDFVLRSWLPGSGWPLTPEDLAPYYVAAEPIFGLVDPMSHLAKVMDTPFHDDGLQAQFAQLCQVPDLGQTYAPWVERSETVTCILGATVTKIDSTGAKVVGVQFRDRTGGAHRVRARATVLATGGIEAPRRLLLSAPALRAAMGPAAHLIGRHHMEHPIRSLGAAKLPHARDRVAAFTNPIVTRGAQLQGIFGLDRATRDHHHLLNIHFRAYRFHALEHDPAIIRLKALAQGADRRVSPLVKPASLAKTVRYGAWHLWNKFTPRAQFDHVRLLAFVEQEPDPTNRITLSEQKDRYGCPLPHLHLTDSDMMEDSITRTLHLLGERLTARGLSEHQLGNTAVPYLAHYGGYGLHHMGATRMSDDPAMGVVDRQCRVHGTHGLYVASSSVFPTGGAANPTLTISALALRLADHLRTTLLHGQS